jgi:unsaturated rhamnogalacturonyl hydrolase
MRHPLALPLCLLAAALFPAVATMAQPAPPGTPSGLTGAPASMDPAYLPIAHQPTPAEITAVLERVRAYVDSATPARLVDRQTQQEITDFSTPNPNAGLERDPAHPFQVASYEWGVAYAGMLSAAEATGDPRFSDFVARRFTLIGHALPLFRALPGGGPPFRNPLRGLLSPQRLDDIGAMDAALVKARRAGVGPDLKAVIDTAAAYLSSGQFRLADGTLARHWPVPESVWADDMYMSVPALAQTGKLTGDGKYYDDAVRQVLQISSRLFEPAKGIYRHGWISSNPDSLDVHWARANGWCMMAMCELLDVLPADHPGREPVLALLRAHIRGVAALQSGVGLWHQLLDRPDSYLETSASAMFVFSIAHAVNQGWISPAYGTVAQTGWNAVAGKVNAQGQVEGTCVGSNFALDVPYYYFRPTSPLAAHGYGPTLLAGAEMLRLLKSAHLAVNPEVGSIYFMEKADAAKVQR